MGHVRHQWREAPIVGANTETKQIVGVEGIT